MRVRQAANYAIDADAIIENLLTGTEERAYSPFPAGYDPPIGNLPGQYNYDPDKARALLEEAGQIGFAFTITLPTGLWTADRIWMPAVQQMLNDVGFQVEVDYADFGNSLSLIRNNEVPNPFVFNQAGVSSGAPLGPAFAYRLVTTVGSPYSHAQETDDFLPEFEAFQALIDEANAEFDLQTGQRSVLRGRGDLVRERVPGAAVRSAAPLRGDAADPLQRVLRHLDRPQRDLRAEAEGLANRIEYAVVGALARA